MNSKTDIQAAVAAHLPQLEADGRAAATVAQRRRHCEAFAGWLEANRHPATAASVAPGDIATYFARPELRALKTSTVNTMKTSVRELFRWLHLSGALRDDPARLLRRGLCAPPPPRGLSREERSRLEAVLAGAPLRDRALFGLMLAAGLRVGSAVALDVDDLDFARGVARLRSAKGAREEVAHLPRRTADLIERFAEGRTTGPLFASSRGRRLTTRHVQRLFTRYAAEAGLSVSSTHTMRHAFAMDIYERTGDLLLVRKALRHRSLESTLVYARADDRRLREVLGA